MEEFEPKIVAFLCNWCTYTGADLAGTSRLQYPPNVRNIRLMFSLRSRTGLNTREPAFSVPEYTRTKYRSIGLSATTLNT